MPWKESSVMDERIRFVIRLKDGESMANSLYSLWQFFRTSIQPLLRGRELRWRGQAMKQIWSRLRVAGEKSGVVGIGLNHLNFGL